MRRAASQFWGSSALEGLAQSTPTHASSQPGPGQPSLSCQNFYRNSFNKRCEGSNGSHFGASLPPLTLLRGGGSRSHLDLRPVAAGSPVRSP